VGVFSLYRPKFQSNLQVVANENQKIEKFFYSFRSRYLAQKLSRKTIFFASNQQIGLIMESVFNMANHPQHLSLFPVLRRKTRGSGSKSAQNPLQNCHTTNTYTKKDTIASPHLRLPMGRLRRRRAAGPPRSCSITRPYSKKQGLTGRPASG